MRKLAYKRNAGNYGENSVAFTNLKDVELLNKLGFNINPDSYLFLARGESPENIYTYIEKAAGIPESVSKAIDKNQAFSAEYLKELDYKVPGGYEVKGDLVVPIEKKARFKVKTAEDNYTLYRGTKEPLAPPDSSYYELLRKALQGELKNRKEQKILQELARRQRGFFTPDKTLAENYAGTDGHLYSLDLKDSDLSKIYGDYNNLGKANQALVLNVPHELADRARLVEKKAELVKQAIYDNIVIENPKGSKKEFGKNYPIPVMTYPVDYGYLPGYIAQDDADLDFFKGSDTSKGFHGSFDVWRPDVKGELETKFYTSANEEEKKAILEAFKKVIRGTPKEYDNATLLDAINSFKVKTAAADPSQTILITGHSGSGKSTLGKLLAEKLNLPLHRVDAQQSWDDLRANMEASPDYERKALTPGTIENRKYIRDLRKIVGKSLNEIEGPAILEGTQVTTLPPKQLAKYRANILVGGNVEQSIAQRLQRMIDKAAKKNITFSPEELDKKRLESELVANSWKPGIEKFKQLPGVLRYNHTEDKPELLIDRLREILEKKAAAEDNITPVENPYNSIATDLGVGVAQTMLANASKRRADALSYKGYLQQEREARSFLPENVTTKGDITKRNARNIMKLRNNLLPMAGYGYQAYELGNRIYKKDYPAAALDTVSLLGSVAQRSKNRLLRNIGLVANLGGTLGAANLDIRRYNKYKNSINPLQPPASQPTPFKPYASPLKPPASQTTPSNPYVNPLQFPDYQTTPFNPYVNPLQLPNYQTTPFNPYKYARLEKEASNILPHQRRIVEKLEQEDQPGLILMHGLGSGKTRSSIEAYKKLGLPAEVIVPAALKENYRKELKKWLGKTPKNVDIKSQQEIARKGLSSDIEDKLMIIDEAHRLRNAGNKLYQSISKANPKKRLLLTGTPVYNHPSDIAPLINLAAGEDILPTTRAIFEDKFIEYKDKPQSFKEKIMGLTPAQEINIKNKSKLKAILQKYIDYYGGQSADFPETSYEHISVPMNERQTEIYKTLIKDLPWLLRKKVEMGLAPQRKELDKLMPFLTGGRMISNSTRGFEADPANVRSPKIEKAFEYLKNQLAKDPEYKALVYSNYLDSGVNEYKKLLEKEKIPYGEFTGDVKDRLRDQMIKDYNANKLKALLVSSAGGEGLDLKGTRLVQILEPHFNNEKLKQVIGRAARFKSHEGLSPEKKKVLVQHYLSSLSPSWLEKKFGGKTTTTDEYLQSIADEKERLNNEIIKLIKTK